jgi:hypothetical protein
MAAFSTSGIFPPRALRIVAILLIFTLNFVIADFYWCKNTKQHAWFYRFEA